VSDKVTNLVSDTDVIRTLLSVHCTMGRGSNGQLDIQRAFIIIIVIIILLC